MEGYNHKNDKLMLLYKRYRYFWLVALLSLLFYFAMAILRENRERRVPWPQNGHSTSPTHNPSP